MQSPRSEDPYRVFADPSRSTQEHRQAFEEIAASLYTQMHAFARRLGAGRAIGSDEDDSVQEALLDLLMQAGSGRQVGRGWVFRVLRNRVYDALRRTGRTPDRPVEHYDDLLSMTGAPGSGAEPRASPELQTRLRLLRRAIAMLPRFERRLVVLHGLRGLPYDEIELRLGRQKRPRSQPPKDRSGWLRTGYKRARAQVRANYERLVKAGVPPETSDRPRTFGEETLRD